MVEYMCISIYKAAKGIYPEQIKKTLWPPLFLRAASLIQRLGIGYDRTGTVAMANMSCGEQNQSTGGLHDGNAPRAPSVSRLSIQICYVIFYV